MRTYSLPSETAQFAFIRDAIEMLFGATLVSINVDFDLNGARRMNLDLYMPPEGLTVDQFQANFQQVLQKAHKLAESHPRRRLMKLELDDAHDSQ